MDITHKAMHISTVREEEPAPDSTRKQMRNATSARQSLALRAPTDGFIENIIAINMFALGFGAPASSAGCENAAIRQLMLHYLTGASTLGFADPILKLLSSRYIEYLMTRAFDLRIPDEDVGRLDLDYLHTAVSTRGLDLSPSRGDYYDVFPGADVRINASV